MIKAPQMHSKIQHKNARTNKCQLSSFGMQFKSINEDGTFTGYAAVFGNVDYGKDLILPGAFAESLKEIAETGRVVPILWQHNPSEPIGFFESLVEDDYGLLVTGNLLISDVAKAREAFALMKAGIVTGLSIGYGVKIYEIREDDNVRILIKLDLWETSLVTFPMNPAARVAAAKFALRHGELPAPKDFERLLRDAGASKSQATGICNQGLLKVIRSESEKTFELNAIQKAFSEIKITQ